MSTKYSLVDRLNSRKSLSNANDSKFDEMRRFHPLVRMNKNDMIVLSIVCSLRCFTDLLRGRLLEEDVIYRFLGIFSFITANGAGASLIQRT